MLQKEARWKILGRQPLADAEPPLDGDECAMQFTCSDGHDGVKHVIVRKRNLRAMREEGARTALEELATMLHGQVHGNIVVAPR